MPSTIRALRQDVARAAALHVAAAKDAETAKCLGSAIEDLNRLLPLRREASAGKQTETHLPPGHLREKSVAFAVGPLRGYESMRGGDMEDSLTQTASSVGRNEERKIRVLENHNGKLQAQIEELYASTKEMELLAQSQNKSISMVHSLADLLALQGKAAAPNPSNAWGIAFWGASFAIFLHTLATWAQPLAGWYASFRAPFELALPGPTVAVLDCVAAGVVLACTHEWWMHARTDIHSGSLRRLADLLEAADHPDSESDSEPNKSPASSYTDSPARSPRSPHSPKFKASPPLSPLSFSPGPSVSRRPKPGLSTPAVGETPATLGAITGPGGEAKETAFPVSPAEEQHRKRTLPPPLRSPFAPPDTPGTTAGQRQSIHLQIADAADAELVEEPTPTREPESTLSTFPAGPLLGIAKGGPLLGTAHGLSEKKALERELRR
eukprot:Hpha_TRINITY_DN15607_c0_g10::TRINITY_DN15607_c0_g10_i1::g.99560::m.99560